MLETTGDLWYFNQCGHYTVVTTNGNVDSSGCAVMGKGVALQAKKKFPKLPRQLGAKIKRAFNFPYIFPDYNIITLPTKKNWWEKSDLGFVIYMVEYLANAVNNPRECWRTRDDINPLTREYEDSYLPAKFDVVYMVRPGCSNGGLDWETQVKPNIKNLLDDRFVIVEPYK